MQRRKLTNFVLVWYIVIINLTNACTVGTETMSSASSHPVIGVKNVSAILDSLIAKYDKRVRPNYGGPPVVVGVTMFFLSISSLSEVEMEFTFNIYFRQFWTDSRLAFKKTLGAENLSVGFEFLNKIWIPDTFFVNEKETHYHIATPNNEFIRMHYTGSVTMTMRLTITASCPMNLQYFPMDRQLCHLEIESFGYTMKDIRYKWNEGQSSVGMSSDVSLPQFKVLGHRQRSMEVSLTTGNYSSLIYEIQFTRSMGYYLIQVYIPSSLTVIISWVSFWLNRKATPARVSLGITTVLTITTLMSSTSSALPKISYIKSIDVYLGTYFLMVFASLLEYATVSYMAKRIELRKQQYLADQNTQVDKKIQVEDLPGPSNAPAPIPRPHNILLGTSRFLETRFNMADYRVRFRSSPCDNEECMIVPTPVPAPTSINIEEESRPKPILSPKIPKNLNKMLGTTPSDIDKYSRIVFPVCFVFFNLMYWIIYLNISDVVADNLVLLK